MSLLCRLDACPIGAVWLPHDLKARIVEVIDYERPCFADAMTIPPFTDAEVEKINDKKQWEFRA